MANTTNIQKVIRSQKSRIAKRKAIQARRLNELKLKQEKPNSIA